MQYRNVHFVGIGGAGMSAIAQVLLHRGVNVSGSDAAASPRTAMIEGLGGQVYIGHKAEHVGDADVVVVSSAVPPDNPEVMEARRRGIPLWPRARMLGQLMVGRHGVAIAGTHGKTTTTSMAGFILDQAGLDPTVLIGGELPAFRSNARIGRGEHTVVEADESDRSLLLLSPRTALVTNIEADHLERFAGIEDIQETFRTFLRRLPADGLAVLCGDDERARQLAASAPCPVVLYEAEDDLGEPVSLSSGSQRARDGQRARGRRLHPAARRYVARDVRLKPFGSNFVLWADEQPLGAVSLQVPGRHNMVNALGAAALALELGVPFLAVQRALKAFQGPKRRFELMGEAAGVMVVDDYAHHPTEIKAALAAARATGRRVVAAFQPHRYTRTQKLMAEFADSFGDADVVALTDIYAAGEAPIPGVDAAALATGIRQAKGTGVIVVPSLAELARELAARTRPGDLVLTMGAGNVRDAAAMLLEHLQEEEPAAAGVGWPASGGKS